MSKITILFKIGEDLKLDEFNSGVFPQLKTGEPLTFVKHLAETKSNERIILFDSGCKGLSSNGILNSNVLMATNGDGLDQIRFLEGNKNEYTIILWQGMRANNPQKMEESYIELAKLQKFFRDLNVKNKQYFIQTDLRIPLFNLSEFTGNKSSVIDPTQLTLLSQATVDYRDQLEDIFKTETREIIKSWCGNSIYTEFKGFQHLELYLLAETNCKGITSNKKPYDISFLSQGYATMLPRRRELFRKICCSDEVLDNFSVIVIGRNNEEDIEAMAADGILRFPEFVGRFDWDAMPHILAKSKATVCINNSAYDKFGLIPNRVIEAITLSVKQLFIGCDAAKDIYHELFDTMTLPEDGTDVVKLIKESIRGGKNIDVAFAREFMKQKTVSYKNKLKNI